MAVIQFFGSMQVLFDGQESIELDVKTLGDLLKQLPLAYPDCDEAIAEGVSVSINGKVYNDAWFTPIKPTSEVVILPRITGG